MLIPYLLVAISFCKLLSARNSGQSAEHMYSVGAESKEKAQKAFTSKFSFLRMVCPLDIPKHQLRDSLCLYDGQLFNVAGKQVSLDEMQFMSCLFSKSSTEEGDCSFSLR